MPNRLIKESIWSSETLSKVSFGAQNLFFRLLPLPDDHGCFDARPAVLRGKLFPFMLDKVRESDIEKWLTELRQVDCIRLWMDADDGVTYGLFPNWSDHQNIRSLHKRKTPPPPEDVLASSCEQLRAVAPLNPNPNHNLNPKEHTVQPTGRTAFDQKSGFEEAWKLYPKREGRKQAFKHYCATVKSQEDHARLLTSLGNYKRLVEAENAQRRGDPRPWKHGSTWFNNWQDYEDIDLSESFQDKWERLAEQGKKEVFSAR